MLQPPSCFDTTQHAYVYNVCMCQYNSAVRLVVDTGIHQKRWKLAQAVDYMIANTLLVNH
jgi:hypothetical protein